MADCETVVGKPIVTADGTTIIPVSKISVGFASGGSDLPTKSTKETFGGGSGGGVTIQLSLYRCLQGRSKAFTAFNECDKGKRYHKYGT